MKRNLSKPAVLRRPRVEGECIRNRWRCGHGVLDLTFRRTWFHMPSLQESCLDVSLRRRLQRNRNKSDLFCHMSWQQICLSISYIASFKKRPFQYHKYGSTAHSLDVFLPNPQTSHHVTGPNVSFGFSCSMGVPWKSFTVSAATGNRTAVLNAPELPHHSNLIPDLGKLNAKKMTINEIANPQSKAALVT